VEPPATEPFVAPSGRELLDDESVRRFLVASSASSLGMFLQAAALGKQLFDITDSELALGLLGLVEFLPALILLPLTGSAADRFDRRRVAAIGFILEAATSVAFCVYAASDPTSGAPLFVLAALFGVSRAFVAPSVRSLPPLLAPPGGLPRLIAFYTATWQFGMILGPASSGFLYDVDPTVPYITAAGCFLVAAVTVTFLTPVRAQQRTPVEERATLHHALEGLRFIRRQPVLLGAISLDLFAVLFGGAVALLPAIAEERLGAGNVGYGWLRAAPGIGAVVLTAVLAARPVRRHVGARRRGGERVHRGVQRARRVRVGCRRDPHRGRPRCRPRRRAHVGGGRDLAVGVPRPAFDRPLRGRRRPRAHRGGELIFAPTHREEPCATCGRSSSTSSRRATC
jgi:MFS family permease